MKLVTAVALKAFEHNGRQVQPGEPVQMTPGEALKFKYSRHVTLSAQPRVQTRALQPEPTQPEPPKPRGRRRRADAEPADEPSTSNPEPRTYRRRDLVPEP